MKWAFWKRKPSKRKTRTVDSAAPSATSSAEPDADFDPGDADAEESAARNLRVRTRRRLIGACALLLAAVILVPMVLDPTPHAVPDTIPIDLPSDKTPFPPRLAAPAPDAAGESAAAGAAVPAAPGAAADAAADAAPPAASPGAPAAAEPPAAPAHGQKHAADKARTEPRHAATGRIFLQAAAMSRESAAKELAARITKAGFAPFVEHTETAEGPRYRVRLGPYATRAEADHVRDKLKSMRVDANLVGP